MAATGSMILATAGEAADAFPYAGTAWTWGNPQPQGQELGDLEFAGSFGIAFADGEPFLSRNGGASWAPATLPGLTSARFLANGSIVGGGADCTLRRSDDGGRTSRPLALAPSAGRPGGEPCVPPDFSFPTPNVGFVQRDGLMLRTTDGGASFRSRTPVQGALTFTKPDTGFALSLNGVARTTDGAETWTLVASSTTELTDLTFPDADHGYATGEGGTLLRTVDGGATWTRVTVPGYRGAFHAIRCAGADTCLAVYAAPSSSDTGTRLVRINDGGASVRPVSGLEGVRAVAYTTGGRVAAVGDSGLMAYSDDGGASFRETSKGSHDSYFKVFRGAGRTLFAGGVDVGRSDDSGRTWRRLALPRQPDLEVQDISFGDHKRGAALFTDIVATRYALWTTSNGGASWQRRRSARNAERPSGIVALRHGRLITDFGGRGVWLSRDSGRRFRRVASPVVRKLRVVGYARRGRLAAAFGARTLALTTNGTSWRRVPLPEGVKPGVVELVSRRLIIVVDYGGRGSLWRTDTGGRRWRELPGTGAFGPVSMSFADGRHGMMLGTSSVLNPGGGNPNTPLRTDDGGRTWRPQFDDYSEHGSVIALDRVRTVLGGPGVLRSGTGGDPPRRRSIHLRAASHRGNVWWLRGRLTRPRAAERVLISRTDGRGFGARLVPVSGSGRFRLKIRLRRSSWLVAQAVGDDAGSGAGSRAIRVRVTR